ncbi:MAG: hypothetical protein WCA21_17025 [Terracidiphilus sp.]
MAFELPSRMVARIGLRPRSLFLIFFCAAVLFWTAAMPLRRAFLFSELDYNEGWNLYNAQKVALHQPLYPVAYGWTTVNYPALSFHLVAFLGRFTSEYLFTARILSLAGLSLSALFTGLIVWMTTRSRAAAWLSGAFLVAWFSAAADSYVGMDDPQMLAQAFFLAGIYVYLRGNRRGWALEAAALLFVVGGNIKHNLIEFPIAVLLDLLICSPRKALRFALGGGMMAAFSILLTRQIDGAAYVSCMLAPRSYSAMDGINAILYLPEYSPLPVLAALVAAFLCWSDSERRVLTLLLGCALLVDTVFCGGSGVDINGFFGSMLAMTSLCGVFAAESASWRIGRFSLRSPLSACVILFLGLAAPMIHSGNARPDQVLAEDRQAASRFAVEIAYLREQPGPALCESLLRCAYAGKPYLYDPFNATRLIGQGKLDPGEMIERIKNHAFCAIQMYNNVDQKLADPEPQMSFTIPILQAINQYYRPGLENEDGVIYLPRNQDKPMHPQ